MKKILNGVTGLSAIATACANEVITSKQKLINGIKDFLSENESVLELNLEFNNVASFKKVMIKNVYIDAVNKSLYVSLGCGKRLKVVNDFDFDVKTENGSFIESISLSISELLSLVEKIESVNNSRIESIKEVKEVVSEFGITKEEIFGHAKL